MDIIEMIRKIGNKWFLYSKDGSKKLGEFDTEEEAKKREEEINKITHSKESVEVHENLQEVNLHEQFENPLTESHFDDTALVIKNVALLGKVSKNNREYSENAMKGAPALLEGATMYLNHQRKNEQGDIRDVRDLLAEAKNVRYDGHKVRADMFLVDTKEIREEIYPRVKAFKHKIGNSFVGIGKSFKREGKEIVEEITSSFSVDLVTQPATNIGLFESVIPSKEKIIDGGNTAMTLEEIKKDFNLWESIKKALATEFQEAEKWQKMEKEHTMLKEENARQAKDLSEYQIKEAAYQKAELRDKLIREYVDDKKSLPKWGITEEFATRLYDKCEDEPDMRKMLNEQVDFCKKVAPKKGINYEKDLRESEGGSGQPSAADIQRFANAR